MVVPPLESYYYVFIFHLGDLSPYDVDVVPLSELYNDIFIFHYAINHHVVFQGIFHAK